ncbi:hypothetical protein DN748_08180 [Sinomicrobium soli]|nr:hypothetical protein DN748_08180 [Sinomicrobium sp. N-1-3-6]
MLLVLVGLYAISPLNNREIYRGSFSRDFTPENTIIQKAILDLGVNSYYISGLTEDEVYLSNYTAIRHLLRMNISLKDTQHIQLKIKGLDSVVRSQQFRTKIEPPYFYMAHGIAPALLRGKVDQWEAHRFMPDSIYFTSAVPIDSNAFAVRYYSKTQDSYELGVETAESPYFRYNHNLLQKQAEGFFSVDGMLHYSKDLDKIIYLYKYRNEYMLMDKKLNLLKRYNTLDTISQANVQVKKVNSENSFELTSQPALTQRMSSVSGKYLYINSGVLAQNEDEDQFTKNSVVDVYDLTKGEYLLSFYLPPYKNKGISDFKIINNKLITIQDQYLISYDILNSSLFQNYTLNN